jgi:hypothetical protein
MGMGMGGRMGMMGRGMVNGMTNGMGMINGMGMMNGVGMNGMGIRNDMMSGLGTMGMTGMGSDMAKFEMPDAQMGSQMGHMSHMSQMSNGGRSTVGARTPNKKANIVNHSFENMPQW